MIKPNGWENVKSLNGSAAYRRIPAGGYVCEIKHAEETENWGRKVFRVEFEVIEGDYKNYFTEDYKSKIEKFGMQSRWGGVYEINEQTNDGSINPFLKGFFTAVEDSNPGYKWNWEEKTLVGKQVGILIREHKYLNKKTNKPSIIMEGCNARSVKNIHDGNYQIPDPYAQKKVLEYEANKDNVPTGFVEATTADDDLPF